jgi:hypothetical protein
MKRSSLLLLMLAMAVCSFARAQSFDMTTAAAAGLASAAQAFGQQDDITVLTVRSVAACA